MRGPDRSDRRERQGRLLHPAQCRGQSEAASSGRRDPCPLRQPASPHRDQGRAAALEPTPVAGLAVGPPLGRPRRIPRRPDAQRVQPDRGRRPGSHRDRGDRLPRLPQRVVVAGGAAGARLARSDRLRGRISIVSRERGARYADASLLAACVQGSGGSHLARPGTVCRRRPAPTPPPRRHRVVHGPDRIHDGLRARRPGGADGLAQRIHGRAGAGDQPSRGCHPTVCRRLDRGHFRSARTPA